MKKDMPSILQHVLFSMRGIFTLYGEALQGAEEKKQLQDFDLLDSKLEYPGI